MRPTFTKTTHTDGQVFKTRKGAENTASRDSAWNATHGTGSSSTISITVEERGPKEFVIVWHETTTLTAPSLHTPCVDCGVSVPTVLAGNGHPHLSRCTDGNCHRVPRDAFDVAVRYEKAHAAWRAGEGGWDVVQDAEWDETHPHEHEDNSEGPGEGPCTDECVARHPHHVWEDDETPVGLPVHKHLVETPDGVGVCGKCGEFVHAVPGRPNAITDEATFLAIAPKIKGGLTLLQFGSFQPARPGLYAAAEVLCSGDPGGFSTHRLIFNDEHGIFSLESGHYCLPTLAKAREDLASR